MKTILSIVIVVCCCIQLPLVRAQAPSLISYQGQLLDDQGQPLADGTYTLSFKIFTVPAGGTEVWGPQVFDGAAVQGHGAKIPVTDGYFSLLLGPVDEDGDSIVTAFNGEARYLEITVEGDGPIAPRQQLVSAPFALSVANNAIGSDQIADGAIVNADIANLDAGKLNAGTIAEIRLPQNGIDSSEIENNSLTADDLAPNSVGASEIINNSVGSADLANVIGIGTDSPDAPLEVVGSYANNFGQISMKNSDGEATRMFVGAGTSGAVIGVVNTTTDSNGGIAFQTSDGGNAATRVRIAHDGTVFATEDFWIGKDVYVVGDFSAAYVTARGPRTTHTQGAHLEWNYIGQGYTYLLNNQGAAPQGGIIFGEVDTAANRTEWMRVRGDGRVGIGDTTPDEAKLVVKGVGTSALLVNQSHGFLNSSGAGVWTGPVYQQNLSIYADSDIVANAFGALSDARIKDISGISESSRDLDTVMKLEITDYSHIDKVTNGGKHYKKLIAQQVETVFPQAVSRMKNVIPDIYAVAEVEGEWLNLDTDLKVGEKVRLIAEKGDPDLHEVLEIRAGGIRTDFEPETDKVFVYGREVDDFRTVDYEAISMLNVSATQELHRQLQEKAKHIEDLQRQLRAVKDAAAERTAVLEAENSRRDARLVRLERLISGQKNESPVRAAGAAPQGVPVSFSTRD